jgi:AcrR family transcriptional regulator
MEEISKNLNKGNQIIEVAQKLFGMYGLEKVSMLEIANELNLSKAALYYYFPHKESLYIAVLEKEQAEFISKISEKLQVISQPEEMLSEYAVMRLEYFGKLMNLSRLRLESFSNIKPVLKETNRLFREKEMEIVKEIFRLGTEKKIFKIDDSGKIASLYLDLLKGLRVSILTERRKLVINREEYESLREKIRSFTDIFIKGLKCR